jgi:hypothetical protein
MEDARVSKALAVIGTIIAVVAITVATAGIGTAPAIAATSFAVEGTTFAVAGVAAASASIFGLSVGTLAAIAGGLSIASSLLAPKPQAGTTGGSATDWKADPGAGVPYAMGRTLSSGNIVHDAAYGGTDNPYQSFVTCYSGAGPAQSIDTILLNQGATTFNTDGSAVGGYNSWMWLKTQLGAQPESAALAGPFGDFTGWNAVSKLSGLPASILTLKYDKDGKAYPAGIPKLQLIGHWVRVYDPRLDSTYPGGSGSQRSNDETTWTWSANPWLHALTWALGRHSQGIRTLGVGMPISGINVASYVDAANVADANAWTLGGVIYSTDDKWNALKQMAQAGGGFPIRQGALLSAFVSKPRVSLFTINENDLAGPIKMTAMQTRRARINGIVPKYRSEDHDWEIVPGDAVRSTTYATEDGEPRTREVEYSLVQCFSGHTPDQAAQLAAYEVADGREITPITVPVKAWGLAVRSGDAVTLNLPTIALNNQLCVVLKREVNLATGSVTLVCRSETTAKHAFALARTGNGPPSAALSAGDPTVLADNKLINFGTQVIGPTKPDPNATRNVSAGTYSSSMAYVRGDIVGSVDGTRSYIAKQAVPAGTPLTNTAYFDLLVTGGGGAAGANAFQASLANPVINVSTASDGTGGNYSAATGQMSLYEGSINRTASSTFALVGTPSWASINSSGVYTVTDPGSDQATVQFDVSYGSVTYRLTLNATKSRRGTVGSAGAAGANGTNGTNGTNGAPGTNGTNGVTFYTWIAYADSIDGAVNFSNSAPSGRAFIGIATNKTTATESTTPSDYQWNPYKGPPSFGLVNAAYCNVAGNRVTKIGTNSAWDASVYSSESWTGAAQLSFMPITPASNFMVGLNSDPLTDNSYGSLDYAFYCTAGDLRIYESGSQVGIFGTYSTTDVLSIQYDGKAVRYYQNGTLLHTTTTGVTAGATMFLDSSLYDIGAGFTVTAFVAAGAAGTNGTNGANGAAGANGANGATGTTGAAGANAKTVFVISDRQTIAYDGTGTLSPSSQTTTFTAQKQNTTNTVAWTISDNLGNALTPATYLSATTGDTTTMTAANFSAAIAVNGATGVIVTGTVTADGISDKISIVKVASGAAGSNGTNGSAGAIGGAGAAGTDGRGVTLSVNQMTIGATYANVVKTGQLPRTSKASFLSGSSDVSASTTWSIDTEAGCSGTTIGSTGIITVNTVTGNGSVKIKGIYGGSTIYATVAITVTPDPAPPTTATSGTTQTITISTTATYPTPTGGILTVKSDASGHIALALGLTYNTTQNGSSNNSQLNGKFAYRLAGSGGAWTDLISAVSGSPAKYSYNSGEPIISGGSLSISATGTGLTASTAYEVAAICNNTGFSTAISVNGSAVIGS